MPNTKRVLQKFLQTLYIQVRRSVWVWVRPWSQPPRSSSSAVLCSLSRQVLPDMARLRGGRGTP